MAQGVGRGTSCSIFPVHSLLGTPFIAFYHGHNETFVKGLGKSRRSLSYSKQNWKKISEADSKMLCPRMSLKINFLLPRSNVEQAKTFHQDTMVM